ncbi:MAG: SGNH/GDSL hydrolase family protein [Pseudobutyrivibrio sp.]|nr:SGNH/GDSL hydrolase family protein [Pseudobutyrivibrio sp.]
MEIVKAPTDPEKNRPFFYIVKDKDFFSEDDGDRGISYLHQSDGRLISSAKYTGNIEDESMLKLLETVDGFKKLVHSVGVSVEMDDSDTECEFVFQMYGKEDLYGGGANLISVQKADGSEKRIYMSDINWTEDDNVPGQIKLYTPKPYQKGFITVRLYLNDGYEAPEQIEEKPVDVNGDAYKNMIKASLVQAGNPYRLQRLYEKAKAGKDVYLTFIGGSITQGAGATPINTECYAYKSFVGIKKLLGDTENIHFIKAGVGGTPSELGMIRFERDVLRDGEVTPDLVVVEFAVNDDGDETKGDCYESLVRKALGLPGEPAVLLLFSVFSDDYNLQERLIPVGKRYDLPMASVKNAVVPNFYNRQERVLTKNQYFYDMFHPTNLGHTIMADCVINAVKQAFDAKAVDEYDPKLLSPGIIGNTYDEVFLIDKKDNKDYGDIHIGGFTETDTDLQSVELDIDLKQTPEFPHNWMYDGSKSDDNVFTIDLQCKALVIIMKDSGEIDAATAKAYVDGKFIRDLDPYVNRWRHCNPLILIEESETKIHHVEIQVDKDSVRNKFTILGFGVVK